jgi:hypothetical protein
VIILAQAENSSDRQPIDPDFVLLDSQSMIDLFSNLKHVQNICPAQLLIKVNCNKGAMSTVADFGDTQVYVNEDSIANVLSLFRLGQKYRITYDSHNRKGVFQVHTPWGVVEFHPTSNGLHIVDLKQHPEVAYLLVNDASIDDDPPPPASSPVYQLHINTVCQNFEGYTKKQVQQAARTRCLMGMVACPSERDFQAMVHLNMLKDWLGTNNDIRNAHNIYGPDLASIRGKTVRRKPKRVVTDYVEIPKQFLSIHRHVTLVVGVMFVNSIPFPVSASRSINLITIKHAPSPRTASSLGALLLRIVRVYAKAGFTVSTIIMDYEFEKVRDHVPSISINTTAASEHVGEIERKICVVKERVRGIICTLPYKTLPRQLIIHLLHFVVMWLNNFPVANGISTSSDIGLITQTIACSFWCLLWNSWREYITNPLMDCIKLNRWDLTC